MQFWTLTVAIVAARSSHAYLLRLIHILMKNMHSVYSRHREMRTFNPSLLCTSGDWFAAMMMVDLLAFREAPNPFLNHMKESS